ncbi:2-C-methyl-D-erythritol 4-phosphate cytidylyltransferase [Candidatus Saganbacteria bacterium]|nr:2-C-methyl-D-erythritol 4-phosphate cytidylyltransferase [Candidatus Saganbacteria bacterium]
MKTAAIITAAGNGSRMGGPKQFLDLAGQPILARTINVFEQTELVQEIVLVVNEDDLMRASEFRSRKLKKVVAGGKERQDSVFNGLQAISSDTDIVAIHDGARPFVTIEIIGQSIAEAAKFGAVVVGVPVVDTIKKVVSSELLVAASGGVIKETLDRKELWAVQTPQVFKRAIIMRAYETRKQDQATDDAMLVEKIGIPVKIIMGSYENIKITTPTDMLMARAILEARKKLEVADGK